MLYVALNPCFCCIFMHHSIVTQTFHPIIVAFTYHIPVIILGEGMDHLAHANGCI